MVGAAIEVLKQIGVYDVLPFIAVVCAAIYIYQRFTDRS